jgi:hypothetical protein
MSLPAPWDIVSAGRRLLGRRRVAEALQLRNSARPVAADSRVIDGAELCLQTAAVRLDPSQVNMTAVLEENLAPMARFWRDQVRAYRR